MQNGRIFSQRDRMLVLAASSLAIFTTPLMASMVTSAIPTIGIEFGIGTKDEVWITVSYLLSTICFLLVWARLADLYGKRKVFMIGLIITIAGALLASMSPGFVMLLIFRMVMGIGGAAISSTGVALISEVYPRCERGTAFGINTAAIYVGSSIGPGLGGFLTDTLGWHSTFYMIIPFCVVAFLIILLFKTDFSPAAGEPFDHKCSVIFGAAVVIITFGMLNITEWWSLPSIALGAVLLYLFYVLQKRERYPILNVSVFSSKNYTRSVTAAMLNYASSYCVSFFAVLYLQDVNGWSPSATGFLLLIQPIIQAILTPIAGRMSDRVPGRLLPTSGMILICIGLGVLFAFPTDVNVYMTASALVMLGFGYAMFSAPNTNAVMSSVPEKLYSEASGTLAVMRQAGMLLSMGVASICITIFLGEYHISSDIPAFMVAMRTAIGVCIIMSIAGTILSWYRGTDTVIKKIQKE